MKLMRVGPAGFERPALLDDDGHRRDLSAVIADVDGSQLSPEALARLAALDTSSLPILSGDERVGPSVGNVAKLIGIGLNYRDHAIESGLPIPSEPIVFHKATSCICGPDDDIIVPVGSTKLDWEVELGIVIGTTAQSVSEADARSHVAGYTIVNDVSERAFQGERGMWWTKGKSADTFGPIGPWMVTADEVGDPQDLNLSLDVNGRRMQTGNTATMIFDVAQIVSYLSFVMTLLPGDVICTGTPPGVGMGMKPQTWLAVGDTLRLSIDGLGEQNSRTVASTRTANTTFQTLDPANTSATTETENPS